ncbi:MAG: diacylglycerol kinase family protein [Prevotellaceae bacterium]|jgi:diacylglycerol kinase|nr:diacylglycerol kinase family protein [Prevotellaceae bacterium]
MSKEIRRFGYAFKGIFAAFKSETHLKVHTVIALTVCFLGFVFNISATEWAICLLCIGLVIGMELLNTAIEKVVDLISPQYNALAGAAKDIAASAVLVCAIVSIVIGMIIFAPKVFF